MNAACPLHCRSRNGATSTNSSAEQVAWAGLPVNLDLAFSQNHRDKVYAQYLLRRREPAARRWLRDITQVCTCDKLESERRSADADQSAASR